MAVWVKLFLDKTDVAAAFHAGESNPGKVVDVCAKTHVLFEIMHGDMVAPHHAKIAFAVVHNRVGSAFNQNPKAVRIVCQMCEKAMEHH